MLSELHHGTRTETRLCSKFNYVFFPQLNISQSTVSVINEAEVIGSDSNLAM